MSDFDKKMSPQEQRFALISEEINAASKNPEPEPEVEQNEPTNCSRCDASLERGRVTTYKDQNAVDAICFECYDTELLNGYRETGIIKTHLLSILGIYMAGRDYGRERIARDNTMERLWCDHEDLMVLVKQFEQQVWFAGLQKTVNKATNRGFKACFKIGSKDFEVMSWSACGRTMFTIEPDQEYPDYYITLITADESTNSIMGIKGINATMDQGIELLKGAIQACKGGKGFVRDDKVSYL
jgi:hypothetical protein